MEHERREGLLLLLCHSGGWDRLYQCASAAASAASLGRRVDVVFFFGALDKLLRGAFDEPTLEPRDETAEARLRDRVEEIGTQPPSVTLAGARATGKVRLLACSASTALTGHDPAEAAAHVDEIVGWPTVIRLMADASHVLYL